MVAAKHVARQSDEQRKPLLAYRIEELAQMSQDIFDDRHSFAAARHAFVHHQPAPITMEDSRDSRSSRAS